jgi:Polyketide cyclase / dehydrase and lipid transport
MTDPASPRPQGPRGKRSCAVSARSAAPVEEIWSLVGEAGRWKEWSFLDRSDIIRSGIPAPDGVGALRRFTRYGIGSTEEVVAWEPPHHLAYSIIKGFPVRHHRADVVCTSDGDGTTINWSATFDELVPGTGHLMTLVTKRLIQGFARDAARYADRTR